jgi:hypothetical protein
VSCDHSCFKPCSFCTDFVAVAKFMEIHNLTQVMLKQTWRFWVWLLGKPPECNLHVFGLR